jgi:hypothetical protein
MPIQAYIIAGLATAALLGGLWIYHAGGVNERAKVTNAVQSKTIETLDAARAAKEKADQDTRSKPYGERVDGLK